MTQKEIPQSWDDFLEMYNKLPPESETKRNLDSLLYDCLVKMGKIEPGPEIESLLNKTKEQERLAKEHEKKAEELLKEIERLKGKNPRNAGRKQKNFDQFVILFERHYTMSEIMKHTGICRRTYFRYKKLYEERGQADDNATDVV